MGEEKKEGGGGNGATKEKKEEDQGYNHHEMIVLKVDMHCEACVKKVVRALTGFQGVEEVAVDRNANTVLVKGSVMGHDPIKLCEGIQKKTGRKAQIIYPLPTRPEEQLKDEKKQDQKDDLKKDQPPPITTVALRVQMHCEACAHFLRKRIRKIKGVEWVETDVGNDKVTVKGVIGDPEKLVKYVYKRTEKHASIIAIKEDGDDDHDHDHDNQKIKKPQDDDHEQQQKDNKTIITKELEQKKDHPTTINELGEQQQHQENLVGNRYEYYWPAPTTYGSGYVYMTDYRGLNHYHPQIFSDENPNACFIM